jgi:hypothetical protein
MQSQTGSAFLTDDQTEWVELSRLVFRLKPPEKSPVPKNSFRRSVCFEQPQAVLLWLPC